MELRDIVAWIDERLPILKLSDQEASKLSGHPYAIQNMRKTLRNGHGSIPKAKTLTDLAKVLGGAPLYLLEPITHTIEASEPGSGAPPEPTTDLELLERLLRHLEAQVVSVRAAITLIHETRKAG